MPQIPVPPSQSRGQFQASALALPELKVRATGDAFGENVANAELTSLRRQGSLQEQANTAERNAYAGVASGVIKIVGEQLQKDWRLEAEANMHEITLQGARQAEGREASGDGSYAQAVLEGFDDRARNLIDNASSPYQANVYREGLQRIRFQQERSAIAAESAARKQARVDQANRLTEAAEVEAFRQPGSLEEIRQRTLSSLNASALSPRQREQVTQNFERRIHAQVIESHLIAGRIGEAQAMMARDTTVAALGGLESVRMQSRIQKAADDARALQAASDLMRDVARGQARLDPRNAEHRRMLDEAWTHLGIDRQLANSDQNAAIALTNVAKTYGIIPPAPLSLLNGMALNGNPDQQAFALQTVNMLDRAHPGIVQNSGAHESLRSEADDFRFWTTQMGVTPDDAVRRIQATRTPEFRAAHEARRAEANRLSSGRTEAEIANAFDSSALQWDAVVGGDPRSRDIILSAYRRAFRAHYERTGNEKNAIAAAEADLKRTYGLTRLSGDVGRFSQGRVMKNPVELRLPQINGSHDWAATDLDEFVRRHAGRDVARADRFYESVPETDQSIDRGRGPVYAVSWLDPNTQQWTTAPELWRPNFAAARDRALDTAATERTRRVRAEGDEARRAASWRTLSGNPTEPERLPDNFSIPQDPIEDEPPPARRPAPALRGR